MKTLIEIDKDKITIGNSIYDRDELRIYIDDSGQLIIFPADNPNITLVKTLQRCEYLSELIIALSKNIVVNDKKIIVYISDYMFLRDKFDIMLTPKRLNILKNRYYKIEVDNEIQH